MGTGGDMIPNFILSCEPFWAVDPGLRGCGVALFEPVIGLAWATYLPNTMIDGRGPDRHSAMARKIAHHVAAMGGFKNLIVEFPRIYPKGPRDRRSDPNDLLDVAGVAGAVAALFENVLWVFPQEWKGQVPKEVMNSRVKKRLTPEELRRITSVGALDHNTLDAVGIGLHLLGRLR